VDNIGRYTTIRDILIEIQSKNKIVKKGSKKVHQKIIKG